MARVRRERLTAEVDGDFVVFLIGIRINVVWKVHKWVPVFLAMPRMLRELTSRDDWGLLGYRTRWGGRNFEMIQYWSSFERLHAYAHNRDAEHLPAWADFNRRIANNGSVGIWHETYLIEDGQYEAVYRNMPPYGLAEATTLAPATGRRKTAAGRMGIGNTRGLPSDAESPADTPRRF